MGALSGSRRPSLHCASAPGGGGCAPVSPPSSAPRRALLLRCGAPRARVGALRWFTVTPAGYLMPPADDNPAGTRKIPLLTSLPCAFTAAPRRLHRARLRRSRPTTTRIPAPSSPPLRRHPAAAPGRGCAAPPVIHCTPIRI